MKLIDYSPLCTTIEFGGYRWHLLGPVNVKRLKDLWKAHNNTGKGVVIK